MVCVLSAQMCCTANHFRQCMNTSGTVIYWRLGAMVFWWQDVENNKARLILGEICWQSYASHPLLLQDRAWTGYLQWHNSYQPSNQSEPSETLLPCSQWQAVLETKKCTTTVTWLFSTVHWDPPQWSSFLVAAKMLLDLQYWLNRAGREGVHKGKKTPASHRKKWTGTLLPSIFYASVILKSSLHKPLWMLKKKKKTVHISCTAQGLTVKVTQGQAF